MIKKIYKTLSTPEENGRKIGIFRILTAIFGGLACSYLGMTFLVIISPFSKYDMSVFVILYNAFAWACVALWISLAPSKLSALLRFLIPTLIFSIFIYFLN